MVNIVNVGYASTNCYLVGPDSSRLLVDVGWPETLPRLLAVLQRKGARPREIVALLVTHYHPDHAGLAQEIKAQGIQLVVLQSQVAAIPDLLKIMKPRDHYREITLDDNLVVDTPASRAFLLRLGISGEVISTPGHSDDSATLVLDEGLAFTGDLPGPEQATEEARSQVLRSWERIRAHHVHTVYPGHGPARPLA